MREAIIWDFDGTIVDTETPMFEAWQEVFQSYGATLHPNVWGQMVGTSTDWDLLDVLERAVGTIDRLGVEQQAQQLVEQHLQEGPLREGVRALMEKALEQGVRQAIASSSPRWWIQEFIDRHALSSYIRVIASADDVLRVKPDPAVYVTALAGLGVAAPVAVAIEDSPNGSRAALAAGLACVVVPNQSTANLSFPKGIVRLNTLAGLDLINLEYHIAQGLTPGAG